mmetsp:Transcript_18420/g.39900  ORF Transcript_18420/g.39900 Transcript_18420/m.39900 type:complete len:475 (+) Transcript_18420:52-1476(+)
MLVGLERRPSAPLPATSAMPTGVAATGVNKCNPGVLYGWAGCLSHLVPLDDHAAATGAGAGAAGGGAADAAGTTGGLPISGAVEGPPGGNGGGIILATSSAAPAAGVPAPTAATSTSPAPPRALLSDRKSFLSQFHPKPLLISIIRLTTLTASTIFATYVTDQIEYETSNEKLVTSGVLTPDQCDLRNKEWEDIQWRIRWGEFKTKAMVGWFKYQVTVLIMRTYEKLAEGRVSTETLDRLTMDTMKAGIRACDSYGVGAGSSGGSSGGSGGSSSSGAKEAVRSEMVSTCLWANVIGFAADATVQLAILSYGYYVYYQGRRARIGTDLEVETLLGEDEEVVEEEAEEEEVEGVEVTVQGEVMDDKDAAIGDDAVVPPSDADDADAGDKICIPTEGWGTNDSGTKKDKDSTTDNNNDEEGAMALSYLIKTVRIIVSRSVGLVAASYGGAYGTVLWPGWGTLLGTSVADSIVSSVLD